MERAADSGEADKNADPALEFERRLQLLVVEPRVPLAAGARDTITVSYEGNINDDACFPGCDESLRWRAAYYLQDLRESVFLADTVYCMSKSPGRFVVQRDIPIPRTRDLEVTYTPEFTDIVHELRGHIGAMRKAGTVINQ